MNKTRLEWKVGLFVTAGLGVLAILLLQFSKGTPFLHNKYEIKLYADNVGGLRKGAGVLLAGVEAGKVGDIRLGPEGTNVMILLWIYQEFKIRTNASFKIEQSGFLGDQYVAIVPPLTNISYFFTNGSQATAEAPLDMQEVGRAAANFLLRVDEVAKRLNDSITDLRQFLLNPQTLTNLSAAAQNLNGITTKVGNAVLQLQMLLATNRTAVGAAVSNLVVFSEHLNDVARQLGSVVDTNSETLHAIVQNVELSSQALTNIMADLQAGKGLAGNLLRSDQLANNLTQIGNNLSITTSNLNRLGLWGILWQHKPPRSNPPADRSQKPLVAPKDQDQ